MTPVVKRNFYFNLTLIFGSIILTLIGVEIVWHLIMPAPIVDDPVLGVRGAPGSDWDKDGFRNAQVLPYASIVALGDSQTEGNNATLVEAWPQVLGQLASTSVYQLAVGGYGPIQYNYLFPKALEKKPTTVIVGLYLGNDLFDAQKLVYSKDYWQSWRQSSGYQSVATSTNYRLILAYGLEPGTLAFRIKSWRVWLRSNIYLYALVGNATRSWREDLGLAKKLPAALEDVANLSSTRPDLVWVYQDEQIGTVLSPSYRLQSVDLTKPLAEEGWRLTKRVLTEMSIKSKEEKVRLIINVIPTKEMVYLSYLQSKEGKIPPNFTDYWRAESELTAEVSQFCQSLRLECVFPLSDLADSLKRGQRIYGKTMDGHPLAAGYRVIAESLFDYLNK